MAVGKPKLTFKHMSRDVLGKQCTESKKGTVHFHEKWLKIELPKPPDGWYDLLPAEWKAAEGGVRNELSIKCRQSHPSSATNNSYHRRSERRAGNTINRIHVLLTPSSVKTATALTTEITIHLYCEKNPVRSTAPTRDARLSPPIMTPISPFITVSILTLLALTRGQMRPTDTGRSSPAGEFDNGHSCQRCPARTFQSNAGNFRCLPFPTGSVRSSNWQRCVICRTGEFVSETRSGNRCRQNDYTDRPNELDCFRAHLEWRIDF